ncbi:hypothetical protein GCM10010994_31980 [Chelatococcus reniformis]|uniref:Uncharacterized protein n=2 Tax=Chelatococcus reniformis TaxID=1494448 RepID=A0A916XGV5_9HYPH|nr:hypothetical protein GCM10010994_31980 [Chelatococcus reniformis]
MEAAYWMIIGIASAEPDNALKLQALAIGERGPGDDLDDEERPKRSKRKAAPGDLPSRS